jgi:Ser/Thr protein kinase RdoA (MazF antagonist)
MADLAGVPTIPAAVLAAYGVQGADVGSLGRGLINATFIVRSPGAEPVVLQRLHDIFPGVVNEDIDAVTIRLKSFGLPTPRVRRTESGLLWFEYEGSAWRALSFVPGVSLDTLAGADQALEAGSLLARFHRALVGFDYSFKNTRAGVHDLSRHLANLRTALISHNRHPRIAVVRPLAEEILGFAAGLPMLPEVAPRIVHGDPKLNNLLFSADGLRAICLVDLDTLARMPLPLELGDAFRSWCNPAGEDRARSWFSIELFRGAVAGYAAVAREFMDPREAQAIVPAIQTIYVELAARFCADALNENYFGWDATRFASRSEHNQIRAESQLEAFRSLARQAGEAARVVAAAFAGV